MPMSYSSLRVQGRSSPARRSCPCFCHVLLSHTEAPGWEWRACRVGSSGGLSSPAGLTAQQGKKPPLACPPEQPQSFLERQDDAECSAHIHCRKGSPSGRQLVDLAQKRDSDSNEDGGNCLKGALISNRSWLQLPKPSGGTLRMMRALPRGGGRRVQDRRSCQDRTHFGGRIWNHELCAVLLLPSLRLFFWVMRCSVR